MGQKVLTAVDTLHLEGRVSGESSVETNTRPVPHGRKEGEGVCLGVAAALRMDGVLPTMRGSEDALTATRRSSVD